jgi:hypothetical protein
VGVPGKSVIYQFCKGGSWAEYMTAILRAGDLAGLCTTATTWPVPRSHPCRPARIYSWPASAWPPSATSRLGAQAQTAVLFASNGEATIHPQLARFFEVPIQGPLPEELNYIR